ncbi:MAG TPA: acyltransferase [Chthoniobacterales bacterium]
MRGIEKWSVLSVLRIGLASIVAVDHLRNYTDLGVLSFVPSFSAFEAVLGFLLISGFSVTKSYLANPDGFLWRRIQRVYPIYLASIFLMFVTWMLVDRTNLPSFVEVVINGLFLNQIFTTSSFVGPAWSLSLEFWLYCLLPGLVILRGAALRGIMYLSFTSFLAYSVARSAWHLPYFSGVGYGANLLLLAFIWIAGVRLARDQQKLNEVMWDIRVMFGVHMAMNVAIQLTSCFRHHAGVLAIGRDMLPFLWQGATLCLVYYAFSRFVVWPNPVQLRSNAMRFAGDISYPLYLVHIPVYILAAHFTHLPSVFYFLAALGASIGVYLLMDCYSKKRQVMEGALPSPA